MGWLQRTAARVKYEADHENVSKLMRLSLYSSSITLPRSRPRASLRGDEN
jgi:hypothetical protein